ncbi:HupE/UreJ family protein [Ascidiaceihabitans sp.]|nr:HupE/UreJ family protein [Ascidiaceihabitans sp.]
MTRAFYWLTLKLRFVVLMSSLLVSGATFVSAHETVPTIADLEVVEGHLTFSMRVNVEAFLAGINLDEVTDTDEADEAESYDALRALNAEEIEGRLSGLINGFNATPLVAVDGQAVALTISNFEMTVMPDLEQPRISTLALSAVVPASAGEVIINWPTGRGALVLRQQGVEAPFTGYVDPGTSSPSILIVGGGEATAWETFTAYIPVGFDHILPKGLDHILFVLGLFFLSTRMRPLVWQISAFTLAHTVTLALGAMGWVNVPGSIVEPLIAASIVYVAVENIFAKGLNPWRPFVIFGFGLLHGLGFASVLGEFGLPDGQFIPALIAFNIGVELGQLTVIALALLAVGWFARKSWYRSGIAIPASCIIAAVGAYWCVERVFF